ncbi:MAG: hypothetical protein L6V88_04305 [Anaerotruncus sp.]|nr:MAG: hypothetical protein L6V88_04305 [Anaerotruncus sp.]
MKNVLFNAYKGGMNMANEYDDLLESFMNNSAKVYDEDKKRILNQSQIKKACCIHRKR